MHIVLAGLLSAVAASVFGYLTQGLVFHRYQSRTPATWRVERMRLYVMSVLTNVVFGLAFAGFFALVGGIGRLNVGQWVYQGLYFGLACFFAIALPIALQMAIFVNLHRGFAAGMLTNWFCSCIAAGLICGFIIVLR